MVQAARRGVQNIAEGRQASATSGKTELRLTRAARASLEELRLDDEDFLRQRGLALCALVAKAALSRLNPAICPLDCQMDARARRSIQEGGFSERLDNVRKARRSGKLRTRYLRKS
jgi:hypothetical protein